MPIFKYNLQRPYWKKAMKDNTGSSSEVSELKRKTLSLSKDLEVRILIYLFLFKAHFLFDYNN